MIRNFGTVFLDLVIPKFCPACKTKISPGTQFVCDNCLSKIKKPDAQRMEREFQRKFADSNIISDFTSQFVFEKDKELQHIIHSLKYNKKFLVGVFLGKLLGETIQNNFSGYKIDYIVPVPLHHLKKAEREFNQSYYIAKGISKITGIKMANKLLSRKRYTESQTTMNLAERQENIYQAFIPKKRLNGENVLIVDDVITTGSTIKECGNVLIDAGADKIYAASVAIAD